MNMLYRKILYHCQIRQFGIKNAYFLILLSTILAFLIYTIYYKFILSHCNNNANIKKQIKHEDRINILEVKSDILNKFLWKHKPNLCKNITYKVTTKGREIPLIYHESRLAHKLLDNLIGIEIGPSAHNPYGLNSTIVDYSCNDSSIINNQVAAANTFIKVDIASPADNLPFADASLDYVLAAYVIEHMYDPVKTIKEWLRVVKKDGYVFMAVPHQQRSPQDQNRERTKLSELIERHENQKPPTKFTVHEHYSVWTTLDFLELCSHYNWKVLAVQDVDEKLNVGFTVVIIKQ